MTAVQAPDARSFSPSAYAALIGGLQALGYEARGFADLDSARRHMVVRHDIDFSLGAALAMAEQERALGIASTYFVLLRTEFYNPLSGDGLAVLRRIAELGHTVGLHFDAKLYQAGRIDSEANAECALLEGALGRTVGVISFHRPAPDLIGQADRIAGRINAYGGRFVRDIGYCSDSRGSWRHGTPLEHKAVAEGKALQLLVHPLWWTEPMLPPELRLQRFLAERAAFLDRELAKHSLVHKPGG